MYTKSCCLTDALVEPFSSTQFSRTLIDLRIYPKEKGAKLNSLAPQVLRKNLMNQPCYIFQVSRQKDGIKSAL